MLDHIRRLSGAESSRESLSTLQLSFRVRYVLRGVLELIQWYGKSDILRDESHRD